MSLTSSSVLGSESSITGSEYIAAFLAAVGCERVFTLTGGACAFMIDAVELQPGLDLVCMQHEQSAAMAADAVWRVSRKIGATMATSGPGATNLITGIACSYFDSIPSLHITGQVNQKESSSVHGAHVRQSGFQETKIVEMVTPITKYAVMVKTVEDLRFELAKSYALAVSGRPGPVLIDVPMDIQQAMMSADLLMPDLSAETAASSTTAATRIVKPLQEAFAKSKRPVVLWGGGVAISGSEGALAAWLTRTGVPFVASWAGLTGFDHSHPGFVGQIGVYGNRGANFVLQNADLVVVLGSRLDNRQRSGNPAQFATGAAIHVVDVDDEELRKYGEGGTYRPHCLDLSALPDVLADLAPPPIDQSWTSYVSTMKERYYGKEQSLSARRLNTLSPYEVVRRINASLDDDAVIVGDTGAAVCWLFQAFQVKDHNLFTAGGNSPMGYALPAAIGAKLTSLKTQVVSYNGDGGFQLNLQELQTIVYKDLEIPIVIMNNSSYGIIKQFQDSYLGSRYTASRDGYSNPDFEKIASAYGLGYKKITSLDEIDRSLFNQGTIIIDVILSEDTLIEPKLEMGRPINDQYPYLDDEAYEEGNRFVNYDRLPMGPTEALDEDD